MRYKIFIFYSILTVILLASCKSNKLDINVSNINPELKIIRFDDALFNISTLNSESEIKGLRNYNSDFFDLFTYRMIRIGGINEESFYENLNTFISDTMIQNVKK